MMIQLSVLDSRALLLLSNDFFKKSFFFSMHNKGTRHQKAQSTDKAIVSLGTAFFSTILGALIRLILSSFFPVLERGHGVPDGLVGGLDAERCARERGVGLDGQALRVPRGQAEARGPAVQLHLGRK